MKPKSDILQKFQKKYSHHINQGLSYHHTSKLRNFIDFDFDVFLPTKGVNLQRDLCWNSIQKESLIYTILRDMSINSIVVCQFKERGFGTDDKYLFKVIDGKQRLTTVFDYLDNKFSINIDDKPYFFKDLPEDCQKQISWYSFRFDVHYSYSDDPISDDTLISIFEDCNFLGTPQDKNHLEWLKTRTNI